MGWPLAELCLYDDEVMCTAVFKDLLTIIVSNVITKSPMTDVGIFYLIIVMIINSSSSSSSTISISKNYIIIYIIFFNYIESLKMLNFLGGGRLSIAIKISFTFK